MVGWRIAAATSRVPPGRMAGLAPPAPLLCLTSSKPKSRVNFGGNETWLLLRHAEEPWELIAAQGCGPRRMRGAKAFLNAVGVEKAKVQGCVEWAR